MIDEVILICIFVFITGACIGSFLNVVALRALSKESIVFPASKCPECQEPIKWYDNIPIFSYLFTFRGKCRNCGCKVSLQYPIVETITAILFLAVFLAYGVSINTLLILILLCISIVITITDFKKEYVFDAHSWALIIFAIITSLYNVGWQNYMVPALGLIAGAIIMEVIARLAYYLVKKDVKTDEEQKEETTAETSGNENDNKEVKTEENNEDNDEEDFDINEYVRKNKRAFGEGDTYLAAAAGALLGWKYIFIAVAMAIILQALFILPQFIKNLYDKEEYRLLFSLSTFFIVAIVYWGITNTVKVPFYVLVVFVLILVFCALDTIIRLKKTVNTQGFVAIPFGPALLFSTFLTFFFGKYIISFVIKHVFLLLG